jgi:putative (di)nucleoside polyphosphate hydrolase
MGRDLAMIDSEGFRANVGIVLCDYRARVFWGRRVGRRGWQFPQGGIDESETPEEAMYRELWEETGLLERHVDVLGCTQRWLRYRLPKRFIRRHNDPICIGQKQIWFMLRFKESDEAFDLRCSERPEFDSWRWVKFWYPLHNVVHFKRDVYFRALRELAPLVFPSGHPLARPPRHPFAPSAPGRRQRSAESSRSS